MALPLNQADNTDVGSIRLQPSIINQVTIKTRRKQKKKDVRGKKSEIETHNVRWPPQAPEDSRRTEVHQSP